MKTSVGKKRKKNCSKRKYKDRAEALSALYQVTKARDKGSKERKERRAYFCGRCNSWHLSSHSDRIISRESISNMYVKEVLYGKEIKERLEAEKFFKTLDNRITSTKRELFKRIDIIFNRGK